MLSEFLASEEDGFFYVGHASALVRLNKRLLLFDPAWDHKPYGDYWEFIPEQVNLNEVISKVEFCVVSHVHEDHVCEPILRKLGRTDCRGAIMAGDGGRLALHRRLEGYSFHHRILEPFKWHKWVGLEFYFVPHAFNTVDSSCFVRNPGAGYTVYHGNDNFLSPELIERVVPDIGPVDVAMVPYAFVHWYPFLMNMPEDEKVAEINRLNRQSLDQAFAFVDAFKPYYSVPFGNSLFHVENEFLNKHLAKPIDFTGALSDMQAGGCILGHTAYMPMTQDPLKKQLYTLVDKVRRAETKVPGHQLIVSSGNESYLIDLEHRTVTAMLKDGKNAPTKSYTQFDFTPLEFKKWMRGEITFEQAIGTRQFTCTRVPNVYNLQVFEWMNRWL